jgi:hypothetical protein
MSYAYILLGLDFRQLHTMKCLRLCNYLSAAYSQPKIKIYFKYFFLGVSIGAERFVVVLRLTAGSLLCSVRSWWRHWWAQFFSFLPSYWVKDMSVVVNFLNVLCSYFSAATAISSSSPTKRFSNIILFWKKLFYKISTARVIRQMRIKASFPRLNLTKFNTKHIQAYICRQESINLYKQMHSNPIANLDGE